MPKHPRADSFRRFAISHRGERFVSIAPGSPVDREARTLFPSRRRFAADDREAILKSGRHNYKIGSHVAKGRWAGFPIFTLTLEERATCPRTCHHWFDCYGNKMNHSRRWQLDRPFLRRLRAELKHLQREYPGGFVVRLHVLGDFPSVKYVATWLWWLEEFPALHVFGYTAWPPETPIGSLIRQSADILWDRFAIRASNAGVPERGATTIHRQPRKPRVREGIVCPAQTERTACCGTCTLCWATRDNIVFIAH